MNAPRHESPHADEYETGVLGSVIQDEHALAVAIRLNVSADDFSTLVHRFTWQAVTDLHAACSPVDVLTVAARLRELGQLETIGGATYLDQLIDSVPTAAHVRYHVEQLLIVSRRRRLLQAVRTVEETMKNGDDPEKALEALDEAREPAATETQGVSLIDLAETEIREDDVLLGSPGVRLLGIGGSLLSGGPSGLGKSSAGVQQDAAWSYGGSAFGIPARRPLRILCLQAENDTNDSAATARSIIEGLSISQEERELVRQNTLYVWENATTGTSFLALVERLASSWHPDLIRVDPLGAYLGGNPADPEVIAAFCRNGLNPIATRHHCGIILCHHTPKTNRTDRDTGKWGQYDWQYCLSGSSDLANWARAVLVIDPAGDGVFRFIAAKRWPGWTDDSGGRQYERFFRHATGRIFWEPCEPPTGSEKSRRCANDLLAMVPVDGRVGKNNLIAMAGECGIGEKKACRFIQELMESGKLFTHRQRRAGTNAAVFLARHSENEVEP